MCGAMQKKLPLAFFSFSSVLWIHGFSEEVEGAPQIRPGSFRLQVAFHHVYFMFTRHVIRGFELKFLDLPDHVVSWMLFEMILERNPFLTQEGIWAYPGHFLLSFKSSFKWNPMNFPVRIELSKSNSVRLCLLSSELSWGVWPNEKCFASCRGYWWCKCAVEVSGNFSLSPVMDATSRFGPLGLSLLPLPFIDLLMVCGLTLVCCKLLLPQCNYYHPLLSLFSENKKIVLCLKSLPLIWQCAYGIVFSWWAECQRWRLAMFHILYLTYTFTAAAVNPGKGFLRFGFCFEVGGRNIWIRKSLAGLRCGHGFSHLFLSIINY